MPSAGDVGCSLFLAVVLAPIVASWVPWWEFQGELHLGIDLGTTFSVASVCSRGRADAVLVENGSPLLASVAAYNASGRGVVGAVAADTRLTHPRRVVYATKRVIGRQLDDPYVAEEKAAVPYGVVAGPGGRAALKLDGREALVTPEEVGGLILARLKDQAERSVGKWKHLFGFRFYTATITVPISFDGPQKTRTQQAAKQAGFSMVRLVEEPVAAAAAYGLDKGSAERYVLVYDMGGGTLDVALLRLQPDTRTFLVMATSGDARLGGEDFDRRLSALIMQRHPEQKDVSDETKARLLREVERAKRQLSETATASVALPWGGTDSVSRDDLEEQCAELLSRAIAPVDEAMSMSIVPEEEVEIVLAGGSSRLVAVRQRLERRFGAAQIHASLDADLAISLGASKAFGC